MKKMIYLLDIEGTTTPISFVYDVLFPYARTAMRAYVTAQWDSQSLRDDIDGLRDVLANLPTERSFDCETPESVSDAFLMLMDGDVKAGPLKSIQGRIWESGYASGELVSVLFDDVPNAINRWTKNDRVFIYSSGSIAAQKLLFGHSNHGDLRNQLSGYFDTTTGPKKDKESYSKIVDVIGCAPDSILFATDNLAEADAARDAGLGTLILNRPGNHPIAEHDHRFAESFDEIGK